jgi:hypothetical protein
MVEAVHKVNEDFSKYVQEYGILSLGIRIY